MSAAANGSPVVSPLASGDPQNIAGYRLAGRLGQGGQGVVYLGYGAGGEKVAVKLLHAQFGADPTARARFAREIDIARRVASYSTARVLTADIEGTQPYVVSEFIDGPSLLDYVRTHGPQQGTGLTRLAVGTLAALLAVHQAGIVHRDFKPANVLLPREGPRVVDFGIARVLASTSTLTSQVIGTPAFMAPEQLNGQQVTPATDMFAWGATMAFAATGRAPFGSDSVAAVIGAVLHAEPDLTGVDATLRPVVSSCLAKDPAERPAARNLLAAFLDGCVATGVPGGPGTAPPPEATLLDAAGRAVADLSAAPTVTAVPRSSTPISAVTARPAPPRPAATGRPSRRGLLLAGGAVAVAGAVSLPFLLQDGGGSGSAGGEGPTTPGRSARTRWTHTVQRGAVESLTATADAVLLTTGDGAVVALDAATGKARWTHEGAVGRTAYTDGTLYAADGDRLRAVDTGTGRTRWSVPAPAANLARDSPIAVAGDLLVVASEKLQSDYSTRITLSTKTTSDGKDGWTSTVAHLPDRGTSGLAMAASAKIVVVLVQQTLYGFDPRTGARRWHHHLDQIGGSGGPATMDVGFHAVVGDTVLVNWAGNTAYFYAFEATSGRQRWRVPFNGNGINTPAPATDSDTVYFSGHPSTGPDGGSSDDGGVYALDLATGDQRWHSQVTRLSGPVAGPAGKVVVVADLSAGLWALDTRTGRTVWQEEGLSRPGALAVDDSTAFVVADGDEAKRSQTVHALRVTG